MLMPAITGEAIMNEHCVEESEVNIDSRTLYTSSNVACAFGTINLHIFISGVCSDIESFWSDSNFYELSAPVSITNGISGINQKLYDVCRDKTAFVLFTTLSLPLTVQNIRTLIDVLASDPLYGFVMPRVVGKDMVEVMPHMIGCLPLHERRVVEGGPVLIRTEVLRDFGLLNDNAFSIDSALAQLFIRANRRGVSARVVNTVQITVSGEWTCHHELKLPHTNDYNKALAAQAVLPELQFERLLSYRLANKTTRHLLFDIRNLAPGFNGTAHHVLSLLGPISCLAAQRGMRPYFWVLPESAEFHGLHELYPTEIIHQLEPDQCFDASIRLTQPWSLTEIRDQSSVSTINIFSILDTIAWDCHYIRMPHIEGVWRTMAEYADGFIFNSKFTRDRFISRFPYAANSEHTVAYCSMDPSEYWSDLRSTALFNENVKQGHQPYVLIVGNRYYHKGLAEVVPALSCAFPSIHFKVLGECSGQFHNVEKIASGARSVEDMAELFAHCSCLVFPSFYEGFGLPIFEALAFGKPILARQSALVDELCLSIKPVSELVSFTSTNDMLRSLKVLLEQQDILSARRHPVVLPQHPYRWENSAFDILALVDKLLLRSESERCRKRLEFFYRLYMFDVERAGWSDATQNMVSFDVEKEE